jgi:hypothetical protein
MGYLLHQALFKLLMEDLLLLSIHGNLAPMRDAFWLRLTGKEIFFGSEQSQTLPTISVPQPLSKLPTGDTP